VLALAALAASPRPGLAQSDFHPRWEIPGFDFAPSGVWRGRARRIAQSRAALLSQRAFSRLNAALAPALAGPAPSTVALTGTLKVPAILMRFADTPAPFQPASYDTVLFSTTPPSGRPYTIRTFYEQLSRGAFSMQGQVLGWAALSKPEASYTGGTNCTGNPYPGSTNCNGIFQSTTTSPIDSLQAGLREALARVDTVGFDWGQFDNDGPDGIPNSGDDDGYVDMAIFVHPNVDGACGNTHVLSNNNNNVWSHRYVLLTPYVTKTLWKGTPWAGHPSQYITVRDYTIQSGVGGSAACDSTRIMPIGTAGHESGHGLDLPDLYDIRFFSEGIGEWGLMGSGNYSSPFSPSRMEAWSLSQLGWVTVAPITQNGTYVLGPAPTADSAYVVRVQGSNPRGEYFLLENREAVLADTALIRRECGRSNNPVGCGGGLLVWHVDSMQVANNGFHVSNLVNYGPIHGVELAQADGLSNLDRDPNTDPLANRGDAGDPYPGVTGNTAFGWGTKPAATKNSDRSFVGFMVDSVRLLAPNGAVAFRLRFGVGLTYAATAGGTVRASPAADTSGSFLAPGSSVTLTATPNAGGRFAGWSGDTTATSAVLTLPMAHSYNVTATFLRPLATADVVAQLLTGTSSLTPTDLNALDLLGNNNGRFDIGDFLSWVKATGAPLTATQGALVAGLNAPQGTRP
jgi:M6 family metalloprotease-like protein